ncbi:MAG: ABC transporter substrate-binding protein [Chloroflexi bacterium]|nr:ABC transporter substrate-binding protein [Chloroflexota bacterium]
MTENRPLTVGHSPDADDAFMFYALAHKYVTVPGQEIEHVMEDIESLNNRATTGDLDVTAISAAQYPQIADKYRIMACGASIGRNYGPVIVARSPMSPSDLAGKKIGVPGEFTTSYLLLRIFVDVPYTPVFLDFDAVGAAVDDGTVDAGILLHEGQILYERQGYHKVLDLGVEWFSSTNLPIPLGLDCVHRRMGEERQLAVAKALHDAIVFARANEDDALDYALQYGRGIGKEDARKFVRMYVNEDTVDMGDEGRRALEQLFRMAAERGIIAEAPSIDLVPVS